MSQWLTCFNRILCLYNCLYFANLMNQTILGFQSAFYIRRGFCQHTYGASKGVITFTNILYAVWLFTSDVCGGLVYLLNCRCWTSLVLASYQTDRKILKLKGKAVGKRLDSKTGWIFCCTYLVEMILVKILDLTPILSVFTLLRVMRHYMMLPMFIVTEPTGSWEKMLVMEAMVEAFYLPNYVVGQIKSLNCLWKLKSSWS